MDVRALHHEARPGLSAGAILTDVFKLGLGALKPRGAQLLPSAPLCAVKSEPSCSLILEEVFGMTETTKSLGNARLICF